MENGNSFIATAIPHTHTHTRTQTDCEKIQFERETFNVESSEKKLCCLVGNARLRIGSK